MKIGPFFDLLSNEEFFGIKMAMQHRFLNILVIFILALILYWLFFTENEPSVQRQSQIELQEQKHPALRKNEVKKSVSSESPREEVAIQKKTKVVPQLSELSIKNMKTEQAKGPYANLDDSFVSFDEDGNRYIMQIVISGKHLVYHGDVLLGDEKDLGQFQGKVVKQARPQRWTRGVIPFVVDENLSNYEDVMDAIEYLNLQTNVKLVPKKENHKNFVHVTEGETDCYSYAGMKGGKQEIYLTSRCGVREILHEFMHTIGFFHEQNRGDRDEYIQIVWDNVEEINHPQFKKIPVDFIGVRGRPFDFESIMLYSSFTFSISEDEPAMLTKEGNIIPESKNLLSGEDIHRINMAYPANE